MIDRIYVNRFQTIYEIWLVIDNEINLRHENNNFPSINSKISKKCKKSDNINQQVISWNFLDECKKYERTFGAFATGVK